jgi:hypothetical protein
VDTLANGHIHFHKRRMELSIIKDVLRHQNFPYNLVPVPSIATLVRQVCARVHARTHASVFPCRACARAL